MRLQLLARWRFYVEHGFWGLQLELALIILYQSFRITCINICKVIRLKWAPCIWTLVPRLGSALAPLMNRCRVHETFKLPLGGMSDCFIPWGRLILNSEPSVLIFQIVVRLRIVVDPVHRRSLGLIYRCYRASLSLAVDGVDVIVNMRSSSISLMRRLFHILSRCIRHAPFSYETLVRDNVHGLFLTAVKHSFVNLIAL